MKKLIAILVLAILVLTFTSCEVGTPGVTSLDTVMEEFFSDVDFDNVDGDLDFVNNVDGVNITYESSNPAVISNDGVVTKQREVQYVQVGVTFECNGSTGYKVYNFVV